MATAAYLPLVADRAGPCVRLITFRGLDLTGITMRMQVRYRGDTPGAPNIDLMNAASNAQGLSVKSVDTSGPFPISTLQIRINETTMKDSSAVPYMGELGDPAVLAYDLIGTFGNDKRRLVYGDFVALPTVNGADGAPTSRGFNGGDGRIWSTWAQAEVSLSDNGQTVTINGVDLLTTLTEAGENAADRAESASTAASAALASVAAAFAASATTTYIRRADVPAGLPNGTVIFVAIDETQDGQQSIYKVVGGTITYQGQLGTGNLSPVRLASALATKPMDSTVNSTLFGYGATLASADYGRAADVSAINTSGGWFTGSNSGAGNFATLSSQLVALPSGAHTVNYQKDAGQDSLLCYDNSTYSRDGDGTVAGVTTSARDMVGRTATFTCPGQLNLPRLRAWCFNAFGRVGTSPADNGTVDGNVTTFECRIDNYGSSQPFFQTSTTKNLLQIYAGGNRTMTSGSFVGLADGNYPDQGVFYGHMVEAKAVKRYAFGLVDINGVDQQNALWGVTPTGAMEMKQAATPATPGSGRSRTFQDVNGNLAAVFDNGRKQVFASKKPRVAHVLDMNGWDSTGTNDMASSYQTLINQAAADGVDVVAGTGKFLIGSTIVLPDGHSFRGQYGAGFNTDPLTAATFFIAHTGKGFTRAGAGTAAISIANQATLRTQPTVGSGAWTPNNHDFDYYFEDISDLRMTGIRTTNATRGIYMNGGRNNITDWLGQHFKIGLQIDWSYDTVSLDNLHLWPMWNQAAPVQEYSQNNLTSMLLKRVDNPFFNRIFSIWHQTAIDIGYYPGDGTPNKPAGTVSKLKLTNADLDIGDCGYRVRQEAGRTDVDYGHTATWHGVSMQGRDAAIASALVQIDGPNTDIIGDVRLSNTGGNGVRMSSTALGSQIALLTRVNNWNRSGSGFPAIEANAGNFDMLPGSRTKYGNGGAATSGAVTVWNP